RRSTDNHTGASLIQIADLISQLRIIFPGHRKRIRECGTPTLYIVLVEQRTSGPVASSSSRRTLWMLSGQTIEMSQRSIIVRPRQLELREPDERVIYTRRKRIV